MSKELEAMKIVAEAKAKGSGLRLNEGKPRYDLLHPVATKGIVDVLTFGSQKYAERNWELGMDWSKVLASLKRHLAKIESGEDYDPETGLLHIDHVQCNAHFLSAYYKIYPQGDDRPHSYLVQNKIGLDIDEVLADFVGGMMKKFPEMDKRPIYWNDPHIAQNFPEVLEDDSFWLGLDAKIKELPFEPHCFITSRPCSTEITKRWLSNKGFPVAPIYTVGVNGSKVETAKEAGVDIFIDDSYKNFVELNRAGIFTYLFTADHNKRYDVGFKRIDSLNDI